jgi:hypothetical protein
MSTGSRRKSHAKDAKETDKSALNNNSLDRERQFELRNRPFTALLGGLCFAVNE